MAGKAFSRTDRDVPVPRVRCRLEFRYESGDLATKVLRSVEQENVPYVSARVEGTRLISDAEADSLMSLLHTLDDYLACISVAEEMLGA